MPEEDERTGPLNLKPLVNLEVVNLWENSLTRLELVNFFAAISRTTNLKELRIDNLPLPWRCTKVIARAINFLEKVEMEAHPYQVTNLHFFNLHLKKF